MLPDGSRNVYLTTDAENLYVYDNSVAFNLKDLIDF
jgi:hypothetical protein